MPSITRASRGTDKVYLFIDMMISFDGFSEMGRAQSRRSGVEGISEAYVKGDIQ